ncbi:MAG: IS21 family transposase [Dehalobacterium sp.]|jgi:transposase
MIELEKPNQQGEDQMKLTERWNMYSEIKRLKELGLRVSQIARHLDISRNTVYQYKDLEPDEYDRILEDMQTRRKKLDHKKDEILSWLKEFPDLSGAQVLDWLMERYPEIDVCESTVRNYVSNLRKEHDIPKIIHKRDHEAIEDPPPGHQMQVDFGEKKLKNAQGNLVKLWFIAFVLSNSRQKYVEWLDRPFTTVDVIKMHENAFAFYGGRTKEIVYDQDHLILTSENSGDLILTHEFTNYVKKRGFQIYMCRKQDPQSKGRIENVVGFVKKNFAKHRTFFNLGKLNEDCLAWLERTGNGKIHNTTKKIPAEMFALEKPHLLPVFEKLNITYTNSITRMVRKDNTVWFKGNRYSVPLGTYDSTEKEVKVQVVEDNILVIRDLETKQELARHTLSHEKGKLIKNNNHSRDHSKGIDKYIETVSALFIHPLQARELLEIIRIEKPRYIRDQLQVIQKNIANIDASVTEKALNYCLKYKLFSASDFSDAVEHFTTLQAKEMPSEANRTEIKPLNEVDRSKFKTKPEVRDFKSYQELLERGNAC